MKQNLQKIATKFFAKYFV